MLYKEIELSEFTIVGISCTTKNVDNQSHKDIGQLWQRFFSDKIIGQIPNKQSEDIYCVYTNYESDFNGEYTTIIGCKVLDTNTIPEGLTKINIAASRYNKFISKGDIHEAVNNTWKHIWNTDYPRTYLADFEIYDSKSQDPDLPEVETYLSIKY